MIATKAQRCIGNVPRNAACVAGKTISADATIWMEMYSEYLRKNKWIDLDRWIQFKWDCTSEPRIEVIYILKYHRDAQHICS